MWKAIGEFLASMAFIIRLFIKPTEEKVDDEKNKIDDRIRDADRDGRPH